MGIFGAMSTANTGLRAQAFALEHISGNIANARTPGYKRTDTNFFDLISGLRAKSQYAAGVSAYSRPTNDISGTIERSAVTTHMAINDNSFFVVAKQSGSVDGNPIFDDTNRFTRRGDFNIDRNGKLVNGAGYYLKGLQIDQKTGNLIGSMPQLLEINSDVLPAKKTTSITYDGNLARIPRTSNYDPDVADSELLDVASLSADPTVAGTGVVSADDEQGFLDQSVAGGSVTIYSEDGTVGNVQFRWAKTKSVAGGDADTWNLFYQTNSNASGAEDAWKNVGVDYSFDSSGKMAPPVTATTITDMTINGTVFGNINMLHSDSLTQFASNNGTVRVTNVNQNGYGAGELVSISISDTGRVLAGYSNGQLIETAQITLAKFNARNSLVKTDGGAFEATKESGNPIISFNSPLISKALESSNTDISDEFSKLIVTQQSYTANTRIMTTGDEMLQESINMVR